MQYKTTTPIKRNGVRHNPAKSSTRSRRAALLEWGQSSVDQLLAF